MVIRYLILLLALAVSAAAQEPTKIPNQQLKGTVDSTVRVRITLPSGDVTESDLVAIQDFTGLLSQVAILQAELSVLAARVEELEASGGTADAWTVGVLLAVDSADSRKYVLPEPASVLIVYRNGVYQLAGTDYAVVDSTTIRFTEAWLSNVVANYISE